jgi:hypothetical protein
VWAKRRFIVEVPRFEVEMEVKVEVVDWFRF